MIHATSMTQREYAHTNKQKLCMCKVIPFLMEYLIVSLEHMRYNIPTNISTMYVHSRIFRNPGFYSPIQIYWNETFEHEFMRYKQGERTSAGGIL